VLKTRRNTDLISDSPQKWTVLCDRSCEVKGWRLRRCTHSFTRLGYPPHVQSLDLRHTASTVSRERMALSVVGLGFRE
jgi:hypothetical protein